ncbi:MAG TPA: tyrosine transporter [Parachlamydiales bacterium]|nr:tyrosine transporter [Parachlamydiales bacterium]HCJ83678.1 tyrosine transporter [Parachlamydiales bacterium]
MQRLFHRMGHQLGGTLMVAGITLGVGMLALPVATAEAGFLPSLAVYLLTWIFMICTGLLILEACLWMPKEANLITLSQRLLGKWGRLACWILYLFLFSSLMVAHVAGGGTVFMQLFNGSFSNEWSILLYVLIFSPVVYLGTLWVDRANLILMAGVLFTYFFFLFSALPHVRPDLLLHMSWSRMWVALPVVFTAFGYQSLIPTLLNYMNRDAKKVRRAIIFGTCIPLCIYIIWEFVILGIIPLEGENGLLSTLEKGLNAVSPLHHHIGKKSILVGGRILAFFVLTTSYLGISIAFIDFLADGLKVAKKGWKKLLLCLFVFGLPTAVSLWDPTLFIQALSFAGGFGVALLLGALPILMVWAGRYYRGHSLLHQQLPGGKILLSLLMGFVLLELFFTCLFL